MRNAGENPVILDAGDLFFSTPNLNSGNSQSELHRANAIMSGYEKIGCDAINVGKYELLAGLSFLKEQASKTSIPFVSANLRDATTGELLFDPYVIIDRGTLKVGIIGLTNLVPDTMKTITVDDYQKAGKDFITDIKNKVDIVVLMVNSDRNSYKSLPDEFPDADFIYVSGSTMRTRPNMPQKNGGPYLYSNGKQGKYLTVIDLDVKSGEEPIIDVSSIQDKIKSVNRRFDRLQKKDPDKQLEEIYANQENVLSLIERYRKGLFEAEAALAAAINTMNFQSVPLSRKIQDDPEMIAFVDETLATCNSLKRKSTSKVKTKK
mgnify:FL=1